MKNRNAIERGIGTAIRILLLVYLVGGICAATMRYGSDMWFTSGNVKVGDTSTAGAVLISDGSTNYATIDSQPLSTDWAISLPTPPASDNYLINIDTDGTMSTIDPASVGGGGFTDFDLAGDIGTPQTVDDGETATFTGGTAIATSVGATNTVTINYDGAISDNSDVDTSGAASDDSLVYNGSSWADQKTYYTASFDSTGWTAVGGPQYSRTFTHNLGTKHIIVQVYNNSDQLINLIPAPTTTGDMFRVVATSTTQITISMYNGNAITGTWNIVCIR